MKKLLTVAVLLLTIATMFRCSKTQQTAEPDPKTSGSYVFYTRSDLQVGKIDVYVDEVHMGRITDYYDKAPITCDAGLSLTVEQPPGTHTLRAVGETGIVWQKDIEFIEGQCANFELTALNYDTTGITCLTTLYGTWRKTTDASAMGSQGMIVTCENGKGIVTKVPDNFTSYKVGDVIWKDYYKEDCKVNYKYGGSISNFHYRDVQFFNNNLMRISGIEYERYSE